MLWLINDGVHGNQKWHRKWASGEIAGSGGGGLEEGGGGRRGNVRMRKGIEKNGENDRMRRNGMGGGGGRR
jgi:hypothetical protein